MSADYDYRILKDLADRMRLDGDKSQRFIYAVMCELGHEPATVWEDGQKLDENEFVGRVTGLLDKRRPVHQDAPVTRMYS
jgi:hypothetical protein